MSDLILKREIRKVVRELSLEPNPKMLCSVVRVLSMRHRDIDTSKACQIAKEILK